MKKFTFFELWISGIFKEQMVRIENSVVYSGSGFRLVVVLDRWISGLGGFCQLQDSVFFGFFILITTPFLWGLLGKRPTIGVTSKVFDYVS